MNFYIHHRIRNFIPVRTYSDECYGPFRTLEGANAAMNLQNRINTNTGQYYNKTQIVPYDCIGQWRIISWPDWIEHCGSEWAKENASKWHL
jgi:hypothetical protein